MRPRVRGSLCSRSLPALAPAGCGASACWPSRSSLACGRARRVLALDAAAVRRPSDFFGPLGRGSGAASSTSTTSACRSTPVDAPRDARRRPARGLRLLRSPSRSRSRRAGRCSRRVVLVAGAGWPATLLAGARRPRPRRRPARRALALLAALRPRGRARLRLRPCSARGARRRALVALELRRGREGRVPRLAELGLRTTQPATPVGVRYVWDANYGGIQLPEEATTVLASTARARPLYWRATTLDRSRRPLARGALGRHRPRPRRAGRDARTTRCCPPRARPTQLDRSSDVDGRGARATPTWSAPARRSPTDRARRRRHTRRGGVADARRPAPRGDAATPSGATRREPTPAELAPSPRRLPERASTRAYLEVARRASVPPFGSAGARRAARDALVRPTRRLRAYEPLYRRRAPVVGEPRDPVRGGRRARGVVPRRTAASPTTSSRRADAGTPPLVDFVTADEAPATASTSRARWR